MSRSGYYKWRARDGIVPEDRARILRLVKGCHERHPSHGYRWVHAYLAKEEGIAASADYIRKCFRFLGICAETKHRPGSKGKATRERIYPNLIFSTWETVDRPRQVIVSDMTAFWTRQAYWELALYFDALTKEIVGHAATRKRGWPGIYYSGLDQAIGSIERAKEDAVGLLEEGSGEICVIHTDQGSVYTSKAYNEIIHEANLARSCSRPGKPTDNPVSESLNGWIKEELLHDFGLYDADPCDAQGIIDEYVTWYNESRPSWALGYRTPKEAYLSHMGAEEERPRTFANRTLDPTPKFIREKLARAEESAKANAVGTSQKIIF